MNKIRVLFLINNLGGGGAERVLVNLVNHMNYNRFEVTIRTIFRGGVNKALLSDDVRFIEGKHKEFPGVSRIIKNTPKKCFKNLVPKNKYDIVIAYLHGAATKLLWAYDGKKVAWLHCDMHHSSLPLFFYKTQIQKCFDTYNRIVGVSDSVCKSFSELYGLDNKLVTIYNTNDTQKIIELSKVQEYKRFRWNEYNGIKLITLGRLVEQKGYDRLISVCRKLYNDGLEFRLLILGKGEQEAALKKMVAEYDLNDRIEFGGFIPNPYPYVKIADLFVCSSRYEGLSTVMSETIILGTPIITTNVSGAREVLGESKYGVVVDNCENSLYRGLKELLTNSERIDYYREKTIERAPIFETITTVETVEELIEEIVNEKL